MGSSLSDRRKGILEPFRLHGRDLVPVPTMTQEDRFGIRPSGRYLNHLPTYSGRELQFVILFSQTRPPGFPTWNTRFSPTTLPPAPKSPCEPCGCILSKFRLQPESLPLQESMEALGLQAAFSDTADFSRMFEDAPPRKYRITKAFHKAFIELDEQGHGGRNCHGRKTSPRLYVPPDKSSIEVRVDHLPLRHPARSQLGASFLGRLTDPR